ncbi:protein of unknown function (DUF303) [Maribacter vaceletii]|uniref:Sialate O-acetylesterase domain-containing protein n=1 Tax=Maribacter vaceletii TaxID=1206816 RepID=A0A495E5F3_9FLAO|nr:sialate O-acetylesterase [Maribacter vaceletii]RKR12174.1 protein of unknown function (DUF303) [Maribacter vaceletii]
MYKKSSLIILVAVFMQLSCKVKKDKTSYVKDEVQVVLLAGQSNMAGAGNYDELSEELKARIAKVSHRVWVSQSNTLQKPLSFYDNKPSEKYNFKKRFGPELFVGLTLAEAYPNQEFLLIKEAKGGTALYGAWNPEWTLEKTREIEKGEEKQSWNLCDIHINSIKENLINLDQKNKTHHFFGMAWMQGENDARLKVSINSYAENLKKLIRKYRTTLNVEKLPFVAGQINSHYGMEGGVRIIRNAFLEVAAEDENVLVVETKENSPYTDFPKHSDNVHYNTEGQIRLGTIFANKLIELQNLK